MSTVGPVTVRVPLLSDARSIARVHVDAWRETYSHLLPARFFDGATFERLQTMWNRLLATEQPRRPIRVAEVERQVVGFGVAHDPGDGSGPELRMLYLLAGCHGSGLGQDLLDAVIGDHQASLWMAEDNPRALAFYRRNGFRPTGERRLDENFENLPEIRLAR